MTLIACTLTYLLRIYNWFTPPLSRWCHSNSEAQSYTSYIMAVSYAIILWQIRIFPHSRLIIGFVTRVTRRVPLMEQELSTLLEHPSSPLHIVGFVLLNLYVVFCRSLFVLSSFIFRSLYSLFVFYLRLLIFTFFIWSTTFNNISVIS